MKRSGNESTRTVVRRWDVTDPDIIDALDVLDQFLLLVTVMRSLRFLRCGDVVRHLPTGEKWLVAYADYRNGRLSWWGWPDGVGRILDCTPFSYAPDKEHQEAVEAWLDPARQGNDHRPGEVRRLYG